AANEEISVEYTDGCDINNLSGTGYVSISPETKHKIFFDNIAIQRKGAQFYLTKGRLYTKCDSFPNIKLTPEFERNGIAWFIPDSIIINKDDYFVKGQAEWDFPHPVDQEETPKLVTNYLAMTYYRYELMGKIPIPDSSSFDLLDPYGFSIVFDSTSFMRVRNEHDYFFELNGDIYMPESIKNDEQQRAFLPFFEHDQIFTISTQNSPSCKPIQLVKQANLFMHPLRYTFDLDEKASPFQFSDNNAWKGMHFDEGTMIFKGDLQYSGQFYCDSLIRHQHSFDSVSNTFAYITPDGYYTDVISDFGVPDRFFFNTFPSQIHSLELHMRANEVENSELKGDIRIPFLSDTEYFDYTTQLTTFGFNQGYLDEELADREFDFNAKGGEQRMGITIKRAYFADNERLEMTIAVDWPFIDIKLDYLPQFRCWGNYDVGFGIPNGAHTLPNQIQTSIKGYRITLNGIGAGRSGNLYSLGSAADVIMGEDVSGPDGAPVINLYSIFESSIVEEAYSAGFVPDYDAPDITYNNEVQSTIEVGGMSVDTMEVYLAKQAQFNEHQAQLDQLEQTLQSLVPQKQVGAPPADTAVAITYTSAFEEFEEIDDPAVDDLSDPTIDEILMVVDFVGPFLGEKLQPAIEGAKDILLELQANEVDRVQEIFTNPRKVLAKVVDKKLSEQLDKLTAPIEAKIDTINKRYETFVISKVDTAIKPVLKLTENTISKIETEAVNFVNSSNFKAEVKTAISGAITKTATGFSVGLQQELRRSVLTSVDKNIVLPVTGFIDTVFYVNTIGYLKQQIRANAALVITDPNFKLSDLDMSLDDILENNKKQIQDKFSIDFVLAKLEATATEAYSNFDWDNVYAEIFAHTLGGSLEEFVEQKVQDAVDQVVTNIAGEAAGDIAGALAANVEMDFSNLGSKLKDGKIDEIIKFDPTAIAIRTPAADIDGYIKRREDDPVWGDGWEGKLTAKIKQPKKITASVHYINGTKPKGDAMVSEDQLTGQNAVETYKYWFFEVEVHGLNIPFTPLPVMLEGLGGRVYHHMDRQDNKGDVYLPSEDVRYGLAFQVFLLDAPTQGMIVAFDVALEVQLLNGGFKLEFLGNAGICNVDKVSIPVGEKNPTLTLNKALISASGQLCLNSVEKSFVGGFQIKFNTSPIMCAGGAMGIEIRPGFWYVFAGKRDDPIGMQLFCSEKLALGSWFELSQSMLDVGMFVIIDIDMQGPWIGVSGFKFKPWAYFLLDAGAEAVVYWKPKFGIAKAAIWVKAGAGMGFDYKTFLKSGRFTVAELYLAGSMEFATVPDAYLEGWLEGRAIVMNIGFKFKVGGKLDL
ncbi:MAG: hypothetical protein MI922_20695, partial [Bacteroidales bacterium]|nr:hypothetical protein [Bacteroidales bacterium]